MVKKVNGAKDVLDGVIFAAYLLKETRYMLSIQLLNKRLVTTIDFD